VDTATLGKVLVEDADGKRVPLGSFWQDSDALLVFVRHFACNGCSEHVTELAPRLAELAALGIRTVIVGCGNPTYIPDFVQRQRLDDKPITVVTDPSLAAHAAAGLIRSVWGTLGPRALVGVFGAIVRGHPHGSPQGDRYQQGGTLLVRRGGAVAFHHESARLGDHAALVEVIDAALALRASEALV